MSEKEITHLDKATLMAEFNFTDKDLKDMALEIEVNTPLDIAKLILEIASEKMKAEEDETFDLNDLIEFANFTLHSWSNLEMIQSKKANEVGKCVATILSNFIIEQSEMGHIDKCNLCANQDKCKKYQDRIKEEEVKADE